MVSVQQQQDRSFDLHVREEKTRRTFYWRVEQEKKREDCEGLTWAPEKKPESRGGETEAETKPSYK